MNARAGTGLVSTAVTVAALVAAGVGGFAAFSKLTGGCGCGGGDSGASVTTVSGEARPMPSCMTGDADEESFSCCAGKAKEACCQTVGGSCDDDAASDETKDEPAPESDGSGDGGSTEPSEG
jgi:hypothetical protein